MALAIDPRFSRCKPGGFGAFLIVKRAFRIGRTNRRRLFAEKGDAELADPLARPFQLHCERDGVQFIPVFLMPATVTVKDAVAGFRIDGSPERGLIGHAEHRAATIRDRTWLAQLQHGASITQEERAGSLHAGGAEGEGESVADCLPLPIGAPSDDRQRWKGRSSTAAIEASPRQTLGGGCRKGGLCAADDGAEADAAGCGRDARMISMFTWTACSLFKTLDSIRIPCSVKAHTDGI